MRIDVTAEDIRMGRRGSADCCPVAHALVRATGFAYGQALVFQTHAFLILPTRLDTETVLFDAKVRRFVKDFDAGRPRRPFSFDLPIPEPTP
jgi:hypothetical protein